MLEFMQERIHNAQSLRVNPSNSLDFHAQQNLSTKERIKQARDLGVNAKEQAQKNKELQEHKEISQSQNDNLNLQTIDKHKQKTIEKIDSYAKSDAFKALSKDKQEAILSLKSIKPGIMPDEISKDNLENILKHFNSKQDKAQREFYAKLFNDTKENPHIVLEVKRENELRQEYIKAYQHKDTHDLYYIAITKDKDTINVTGYPITKIKDVINQIKNAEKVVWRQQGDQAHTALVSKETQNLESANESISQNNPLQSKKAETSKGINSASSITPSKENYSFTTQHNGIIPNQTKNKIYSIELESLSPTPKSSPHTQAGVAVEAQVTRDVVRPNANIAKTDGEIILQNDSGNKKELQSLNLIESKTSENIGTNAKQSPVTSLNQDAILPKNALEKMQIEYQNAQKDVEIKQQSIQDFLNANKDFHALIKDVERLKWNRISEGFPDILRVRDAVQTLFLKTPESVMDETLGNFLEFEIARTSPLTYQQGYKLAQEYEKLHNDLLHTYTKRANIEDAIEQQKYAKGLNARLKNFENKDIKKLENEFLNFTQSVQHIFQQREKLQQKVDAIHKEWERASDENAPKAKLLAIAKKYNVAKKKLEDFQQSKEYKDAFNKSSQMQFQIWNKKIQTIKQTYLMDEDLAGKFLLLRNAEIDKQSWHYYGDAFAIYRAKLENFFNINPTKEFGTNYAEYYHDGKGGIVKLMNEAQAHKGKEPFKGQVAGAFYREELGDIDLVWGEVTDAQAHKGYGLAHILDKRIAEFMEQGLSKAEAEAKALELIRNIPNIVSDGKVVKDKKGRLRIELDNQILGIKDNWHGTPTNKWIITTYEPRESAESLYASSAITKGETLPLNSNQIIPQTTQKKSPNAQNFDQVTNSKELGNGNNLSLRGKNNSSAKEILSQSQIKSNKDKDDALNPAYSHQVKHNTNTSSETGASGDKDIIPQTTQEAKIKEKDNPSSIHFKLQDAPKESQLMQSLDKVAPRIADETRLNHLEYSLREARVRFALTNKDKENAKLFDKVLVVAQQLGVKFDNKGTSLKGELGHFNPKTNTAKVFTKGEKEAETILHELIHSVSNRAIHTSPKDLTPLQREGVKEIHTLFESFSKEKHLKEMYALSSVDEMLAELSNKAFRKLLRGRNVLERIFNAVAKIIFKR
ncbi:MAG: hypothetical protein MRZ19_03195, partial [Helicobacter sp.]|nr:hypothetical protein [Helicobacter sp.]